jgi:hypothetical protein
MVARTCSNSLKEMTGTALFFRTMVLSLRLRASASSDSAGLGYPNLRICLRANKKLFCIFNNDDYKNKE